MAVRVSDRRPFILRFRRSSAPFFESFCIGGLCREYEESLGFLHSLIDNPPRSPARLSQVGTRRQPRRARRHRIVSTRDFLLSHSPFLPYKIPFAHTSRHAHTRSSNMYAHVCTQVCWFPRDLRVTTRLTLTRAPRSLIRSALLLDIEDNVRKTSRETLT